MAHLDELEYRLEVGARRTRVVVYEEHQEFKAPSLSMPEDTADQSEELPEGLKTIFDISPDAEDDAERIVILPKESSKFEQYNYSKRMKAQRQAIRELVYNNFDPPNVTMLTLTFDSQQFPDLDFSNLNVAHKEFKKFMQRINFRFDGFKYVATFSRQENQNWHYHVICNISNTISKELIESIWNRGHVWLSYIFKESVLREKVNYCIDNMGQIASSDLKKEKGYLASKGLQRNLVLNSWKPEEAEAAEEIFSQLRNEPHTLLYTASRLKGSKVALSQSGDEQGQVIYQSGLSGLESGEEKWVAKTHYISSSVRLKQLFPLLPEAKLKKK